MRDEGKPELPSKAKIRSMLNVDAARHVGQIILRDHREHAHNHAIKPRLSWSIEYPTCDVNN